MAARDDARTAKDKAEEPSVDDLARQIEALRTDVMTIAETLKELGLSKGRTASKTSRLGDPALLIQLPTSFIPGKAWRRARLLPPA